MSDPDIDFNTNSEKETTMRSFDVPTPTQVDAYQSAHYQMIPSGMEDFQLSLASFRKPLVTENGATDLRVLGAGVTPFVKLELMQNRLKMKEVDETTRFMGDFCRTTEGPDYRGPYPFDEAMFRRIVTEYGGRYPVCVMALPDGQTHYVGEPQVMIWTDEPGMGECVGWLESSLLPYLWSSSTVATRGRRRRERLLEFYRSVHPAMKASEFNLDSKFSDFGRRSAAASQVTGIAHLLNWLCTASVDAAYAATVHLNEGGELRCSLGDLCGPTARLRPGQLSSRRSTMQSPASRVGCCLSLLTATTMSAA